MVMLPFVWLATALSVLSPAADDFYRESPCVVAELAPYLSMQASDWCAVERATAEAVVRGQDKPSAAERALKLVSIRCALLVNEDQFDSTNAAMARFVAYWKTEYCLDYKVPAAVFAT